jgi:hypothetical protein
LKDPNGQSSKYRIASGSISNAGDQHLSYYRLFKRVSGCVTLSTCLASAPSILGGAEATPNAFSNWRSDAPQVNLSRSPRACGVTPLQAIADDEALAFEKGTSPDTADLMPAIAGALKKFQQLVGSVGGTFELKSAYRPPSYQTHLQAVWVKWMLELRDNRESGCEALRSQVGEEFARHRLQETQKPGTSSDHTRGLAFDARVVVPPAARLKKRRVSLDRLALLAGIQRPDIRRDPVHFELAVGRRISPALR